MTTATQLPGYKRNLRLLAVLSCAAGDLLLAQHGFAQETAAATAPAPTATASPTPVANTGHVSWMMTSTALVLLMSARALALFYGGLARTKNMLSVLLQVLVVFSQISVLRCV